MLSYAEDRARRIELGPQGGKLINNTGNSRQVRRARERDREAPISFSDRLNYALGEIEWHLIEGRTVSSMGLYTYWTLSPVIGRKVRRYRAAYLSERMEPSADYQGRYKALFPMPESPAVHQGQSGKADKEALNEGETIVIGPGLQDYSPVP